MTREISQAQPRFEHESCRNKVKEVVSVPDFRSRGCANSLYAGSVWFVCASSELEVVAKSLMSQDSIFDVCDG